MILSPPTLALSRLVAADSASDENFATFDVPVWAWVALVAAITAMLIVDLLAGAPHRPRHHHQGGGHRVRRVDLDRPAFGLVILAWQGGQAGRRVLRRLPDREEPVDRQRLRVGGDLLVLRRAPRVPVPGAVLGHLRRARAAGHLHLRRRRAHRALRVGPLRLRRASCCTRRSRSPATTRTKQVDYNNNIAMRLGAPRWCRPPTSTTARSCSPARTRKRLATPLFAVLVLIEATDVVFAVDSVPAILAVSREPFIVFASNAFAILGLRSLYFLLGGMQGRFRYLNVGLGVILGLRRHQDAAHRRAVRDPPADVRLARLHRRRADRRHRRLAAGRPSASGRSHAGARSRARGVACSSGGRTWRN